MKINKHIEIVRSSKTWLSSMSQESCDGVLAVLKRHYTRVGVTIVNDLADLQKLALLKPDLVFLGMKFIPLVPGSKRSAKVWLAAYLDGHGISYTGSSSSSHQLELSKQLAKQRILDTGLKTPAFSVIGHNQLSSLASLALNYPLFVKPTDRGGGLGIDSASVVYNFAQLYSKVQKISTELGGDSLVEQYLPGREFSVAILKKPNGAEYFVMPLELIAPDIAGERLLSGRIKSLNTEQAIEVTEPIIKAKLQSMAIDVFQALGARDYGRIDMRLDSRGVPHFLEANLLPSLIGGYGSFPKACVLNINLAYEAMITSIVDLALLRAERMPIESSGLPKLEVALNTI